MPPRRVSGSEERRSWAQHSSTTRMETFKQKIGVHCGSNEKTKDAQQSPTNSKNPQCNALGCVRVLWAHFVSHRVREKGSHNNDAGVKEQQRNSISGGGSHETEWCAISLCAVNCHKVAACSLTGENCMLHHFDLHSLLLLWL